MRSSVGQLAIQVIHVGLSSWDGLSALKVGRIGEKEKGFFHKHTDI